MDKITDEIEEKLSYDKSYLGHYHTEKVADGLKFLYKSIAEFI